MIFGCMDINGLSGRDAGRQLLNQLWQSHIGGPLPEIAVGHRGKPFFVDCPWHFSISHTRHHAFCVLSDCPVGLDAEEQDRNINLALAEKILSPAEKAQYEKAVDKRLALLKFWVLKEAQAKLTGEGIRFHPNHTDFSLDDPRVTIRDDCLLAVLEDKNAV